MADLHQIQFNYVAEADRLLLRISTADKSEFRFWLTRRYVRLLWPAVLKLLRDNPQVKAQKSNRDRDTVLDFHHQQAMQQGDFSTEYQADAEVTPLGDKPLLLARLQPRQGKNGPVLHLAPREGHGINLALPGPLLHSFAGLLTQSVKQAEWDLDLRMEQPASVDRRTH